MVRRRIGDLIKQEVDKNDPSPEQMPESKPNVNPTDNAAATKIQALEAEVAAKDQIIAQLEKDLATTQKLKADLEAAKKEALNLAKENTTLKSKTSSTGAIVHAHKSGGALIPDEVVVQEVEPSGEFALNTWLM